MTEIKRFGKFLPHDTTLRVYHGSRKLFTQFSNEFNRSGNGKNIYGWGIYTSTEIGHASWFAMDYHWCYIYNDIVVDGKVYDINSLQNTIDEVLDPFGERENSIYTECQKTIRIENIINGTVSKDLILKVYKLLDDYITKNNMPGRFLVKEIINKVGKSNTISFKPKKEGYIYDCTLSVGKMFTRELSKTDIHFIKGQMRKEGIETDLFKSIDGVARDYSNNFYRNLVLYYSNIGRKKRDVEVAERKASLFLYRCGYQAIECGGGEYVVIDINCLKINKTISLN